MGGSVIDIDWERCRRKVGGKLSTHTHKKSENTIKLIEINIILIESTRSQQYSTLEIEKKRAKRKTKE